MIGPALLRRRKPPGPGSSAGVRSPRFLALNRSLAVARSAACLVVLLLALVSGRGDRQLLLVAFGLSAVGVALFWAWGRRDQSVRDDDRQLLSAVPGWTLVAIVVALAARDGMTGVYHDEILMGIVAPLAVSFGLVLRPRLGIAWLAGTAVAMVAAAQSAGADEIDALTAPLVLALAGGVAVLGRIGLERAAHDRSELALLSAHAARLSGAIPIAGAVTDEVFGWRRFDLVWVVAFESVQSARLLARRTSALVPPAMDPGDLLPTERVRYLRERAERGPWIERLRPETLAQYGVDSATLGAWHTFVPLVWESELIGLLVAGIWTAQRREEAGGGVLAVLSDALALLVDAAAVTAAALGPELRVRDEAATERAAIRAVIETGAFHPVFQPIVSAADGSIRGYEALTRFADGTPPEPRFLAAARLGIGPQLEVATLAAALSASAALPDGAFLSVNVSPALVATGRLRVALAGTTRGLMLELTEHVAVHDYEALRAAFADLGPNVRLAVDDAGAGFASLRHVLELRPDVVKLDRGLIGGIDTDPVRQSLVAGMYHFAVGTRFELLAEGVETEAELAALRSLGVGLAQGYLFGRPEPLASAVAAA